MPHPALSKITAAYKIASTAHSSLFEARGLLEDALATMPEHDPAFKETQQALAQIQQVLESTRPLAETIRQAYRLTQSEG
jgi:hypothetical protein